MRCWSPSISISASGTALTQSAPYRGHRRYSHTGGDVGFAAYLAVFPDDQVGIALMTNSPMAMPTQEILRTAVRGALDLYID